MSLYLRWVQIKTTDWNTSEIWKSLDLVQILHLRTTSGIDRAVG